MAFLQVSAENEAWKLAEAHGLDLVTILPNFNLGPALSRQETKGLSVGFMKVTALPCSPVWLLCCTACVPCFAAPCCMGSTSCCNALCSTVPCWRKQLWHVGCEIHFMVNMDVPVATPCHAGLTAFGIAASLGFTAAEQAWLPALPTSPYAPPNAIPPPA